VSQKKNPLTTFEENRDGCVVPFVLIISGIAGSLIGLGKIATILFC
jgi:hypothetical protein